MQGGRDLGENRIQFLLSSYAVVQPLIEAGKVRVVGVGGRTPLAPGVPTVTEAGYPSLQIETTSGFYGPRGMPLELRQRIGRDVVEVTNDPAISQRIASSGQDVRTGGPERDGADAQAAGAARRGDRQDPRDDREELSRARPGRRRAPAGTGPNGPEQPRGGTRYSSRPLQLI